jgi:jasmonate O-methyltransferase
LIHKLLVNHVIKIRPLQAPEDLTKNHIPAYDIDEHARTERLPMVFEAYAKQFRKDFTLFLKLRAKELVQGGRMVVSLIGRHSDVITTKFSYLSGIVAQILSVMVSEVHLFTFFNKVYLLK